MSLPTLELVLVLVIGFKVCLGSEFVRVLCSWPCTGSDTDRSGLFIADFNCGLYLVESCWGLGMGVPLGGLTFRSCLGRGIEL
jgi:hypothetical protein